jgi:AraC-like DNA-binding protein
LTRLLIIDDWIGEARHAHYSSRELARRCGVSSSHLRRFFILHFFRPPQEWMNELRLWDATKLLSEGFSVKEAAAHLGFADATHFSHRFTRYHGCAPSKWPLHWLQTRNQIDEPFRDAAPNPWDEAYRRLLSPLSYNRARIRSSGNFERHRHVLLAGDMTPSSL